MKAPLRILAFVVVSAALAAAAAGKVISPVVCVARGAELTVRFRRAGDTDADADPATDSPPAEPAAGASESEVAEPTASTPAEEQDAAGSPELPPLVADAGSDGRIEFVELEIEGDAIPIYSGEAMVQASRSPRRW